MSTTHPYLGDDFDKWTSQWEKALADGTFDGAPKPATEPSRDPTDFFGNNKPKQDNKTIQQSDSDYWRAVYNMSSNAGDYPDPLEAAEMLQEAAKKPGPTEEPKRVKKAPPVKSGKTEKNLDLDDKVEPDDDDDADDKETLKKKAKAVADDPNPQYSAGYGRDGVSKKSGRTRISAGWAADESIQKLHDLKLDLYDLECQMSDKGGLNEDKAKNIQSKIMSLKDKIDDLSNGFPGTWATDHQH